jgi:predicted TIM-barrel fold metal-dependent hydrolase
MAPIVDTHVHAVATDRQQYPLAPVGGRLGEWVDAKPTNTEDLLQEMDRAGVQYATFVQAATAYGFDNTYTVDSVRNHADRFAGVCMIDVLEPDAADTLTDLVENHGMRGIRLFTTPDPEAPWIDDPRTFPCWERARDLGIPVIVQIWTRHLPRLRKVVERFRDLPVLLDHLANAQLLDAPKPSYELLSFAGLPNVYVKLSTVNLYAIEKLGVEPAEYLGPFVQRFSAGRMMWGSNYPNTYDRSYKAMVELAREALSFLSPVDQEAVFGGTATSLWPELGAKG